MRIDIIGLGLIGGSLAQALSLAGHEIAGFDVDADVRTSALQCGMIHDASTAESIAAQSEVMILATSPLAALASMDNIVSIMRPGAIITDVCGVKRPIIQAMDRLPDTTRAVGGHPIAGKASGGLSAADPALFQEAYYAVVPSARSDPDSLEVVSRLAAEIGAQPIEIDAARHDAVVALTSQLPQVVSTALSISLEGAHDSDLRGSGLAGMLRLAAADEGLWKEILTLNREEVARALDGLMDVLVRARADIQAGNAEATEAFIRRGREAAA